MLEASTQGDRCAAYGRNHPADLGQDEPNGRADPQQSLPGHELLQRARVAAQYPSQSGGLEGAAASLATTWQGAHHRALCGLAVRRRARLYGEAPVTAAVVEPGLPQIPDPYGVPA